MGLPSCSGVLLMPTLAGVRNRVELSCLPVSASFFFFKVGSGVKLDRGAEACLALSLPLLLSCCGVFLVVLLLAFSTSSNSVFKLLLSLSSFSRFSTSSFFCLLLSSRC